MLSFETITSIRFSFLFWNNFYCSPNASKLIFQLYFKWYAFHFIIPVDGTADFPVANEKNHITVSESYTEKILLLIRMAVWKFSPGKCNRVREPTLKIPFDFELVCVVQSLLLLQWYCILFGGALLNAYALTAGVPSFHLPTILVVYLT